MPYSVADVIRHMSDLPPFPRVTAKLLELLDDPSVCINELSETISTDPSLVLKVIRLSNSPFYMLSKEITSVRDAVVVLGMNTIKAITTAATIHQGVSKYEPRPDVFDSLEFWKHSYATAIAAYEIAKIEIPAQKDTLYLTGLIHCIGKMIVAYYWPETWKRIIANLKNTADSYGAVEARVFSMSENDIASLLLANWNFPDDIVKLVKMQNPDCERFEHLLDEYRVLDNAKKVAVCQGFNFPTECHCEISSAKLAQYQHITANLEKGVQFQLYELGLRDCRRPLPDGASI